MKCTTNSVVHYYSHRAPQYATQNLDIRNCSESWHIANLRMMIYGGVRTVRLTHCGACVRRQFFPKTNKSSVRPWPERMN